MDYLVRDITESIVKKLQPNEFKWKESKVKIPTQWKNAYPDASFEVINMGNFSEWLQ